MLSYPRNLKYAKTHEWARREDKRVVVGITEYAQKELSDVVFVELPQIGQEVKKGRPCAVVESVKAAFDIYAPISGKVVEVNKQLETNPAHINTSPYESGWFFVLEPSDVNELSELYDSEKYETLLQESANG